MPAPDIDSDAKTLRCASVLFLGSEDIWHPCPDPRRLKLVLNGVRAPG